MTQVKKTKTIGKEELLTIGQVVKLLGVHIDTLRKWDKNGKLKSVRIGSGSWRRYKRTDIEKLLAG